MPLNELVQAASISQQYKTYRVIQRGYALRVILLRELYQLCGFQIKSLRALYSSVEKNIDNSVSDLYQLAQIAYKLHRSSLLRRQLQVNLYIVTKPLALSSLIEDIVKRVGKLLRVFRVVYIIIKFLSSTSQAAAPIKVVGIET